ncbi:MAG: polysaccharide deacetylase family protein [Myxococcales bacterium]|nr:polysaccharide deacetylase family protein [Myxococcales bacterium]
MSRPPDATHILMLHRVLDDGPVAFGLPGCYRLRGTALTIGELSRLLDEAGPIVPLEDIESALAADQPPPAGVALTFDDGYREHVDVVAPLLGARGATATFYVATGLQGAGRDVAAVDAWYWLLDHACAPFVEVPLPGGGEFRGRLDTLPGKQAWIVGEPKAALLAATPEQQRQMLAALASEVGVELPHDLARQLYLRPDDWTALAAAGMRVGAHSVGHPRLTQVDDLALQREVELSIEALRPLGTEVPFAYPDGAHDARVVAAVRRAGASSAVTCIPGPVRPEADLLRLPRLFVRPP